MVAPTKPRTSETSTDSALKEFRQSAIPDRLTLANIEFVEAGDETLLQYLTETAIANVQKSTSYVGKQAERIMDRYRPNALGGGWAAWGTTIDGGIGEVAMIKLANPRQAAEWRGFGKAPKFKTVKYETAADCPALPLLPWVDPETAQAIYDRHKITPQDGETFWQAVRRSGCQIAFTEGLKKAQCLIAHGIPAIALRGVACWHPKGEKHLYQQIADFATEGRKVYVVFDQDLKPATVKDVSIQIRQFSKALTAKGCKVSIPAWPPEQGKGIDDAVFGQGDCGQVWLDGVVADAQTFDRWQREGNVARILAAIASSKRLPYAPDRVSEGQYLPEIPPVQPGTITVIEAPTGSGKTEQIVDQVARWVDGGGNVLALYSRNSLGQQTAERCNLPHIHDYPEGREGAGLLDKHIVHRHGIVMCFDSLHRLPEKFCQKPVLLILDEVNQGLAHLAEGGTLQDSQAEIVGLFGDVCRAAGQRGAVIVSEARVHPHSVQAVKTLTGLQNVAYYRHDRTDERGQVELIRTNKAGGLIDAALAALGRGEKLVIPTSSQKFARRAEWIFQQHGYNVMRIDSQTNRGSGGGYGEEPEPSPYAKFFDNPDEFLAAACPDVLIFSPTCATGLSIDKPWFNRVFGYFPDGDPDVAIQMMARYRQPVPRMVLIPPFGQTIGYESIGSVTGVKARMKYQRDVTAAAFGLDAIASAADDQDAAAIAAIVEFAAANAALRGLQKQIAADCLAAALVVEGYEVFENAAFPSPGGDSELREAKESIWRADATAIAEADAAEDWDEILSRPCTLEDETAAKKAMWVERYPGIDFNDAETCYQMLTRQDGLMSRGVDMQVLIENFAAARNLDRGEAIGALTSGLLHKTPTAHLMALLLNKIGVLRLLDEGLELSNDSPVCQEVADLARRYRNDLRFLRGFNIGDEGIDTKGRRTQTPIGICQKLLKCLGLGLVTIRMPNAALRQRFYRVACLVPKNWDAENSTETPRDREDADRLNSWRYRQQLLEAARIGLKRRAEAEAEAAEAQAAEAQAAEAQAAAASAETGQESPLPDDLIEYEIEIEYADGTVETETYYSPGVSDDWS